MNAKNNILKQSLKCNSNQFQKYLWNLFGLIDLPRVNDISTCLNHVSYPVTIFIRAVKKELLSLPLSPKTNQLISWQKTSPLLKLVSRHTTDRT